MQNSEKFISKKKDRLSVWKKNKDGTYTFIYLAYTSMCSSIRSMLKLSQQVEEYKQNSKKPVEIESQYVRYKDEFYKLPSTLTDFGSLPICNKCINQLNCLGNSNSSELNLSLDTIID